MSRARTLSRSPSRRLSRLPALGGGGLQLLPGKENLVFLLRVVGGVLQPDSIGLSVSDAPEVNPILWPIFFNLVDGVPVSVRDAADILTDALASPMLNKTAMCGSAAEGIVLYDYLTVTEAILIKACKAMRAVYVSPPSFLANPTVPSKLLRLSPKLPVGKSIVVDFGDRNSTTISGTGSEEEYDYNYSLAGTYQVRLFGDYASLTSFGVVGSVAPSGNIGFLAKLPALTNININYGGFTGDLGQLASLPITGNIYMLNVRAGCDISLLSNWSPNISTVYMSGGTVSGNIGTLAGWHPIGAVWFDDTDISQCSSPTAAVLSESTNIKLSGCVITNSSDIDNILASVIAGGKENGSIDISGGTNSAPSEAGEDLVVELMMAGWTVSTN